MEIFYIKGLIGDTFVSTKNVAKHLTPIKWIIWFKEIVLVSISTCFVASIDTLKQGGDYCGTT